MIEVDEKEYIAMQKVIHVARGLKPVKTKYGYILENLHLGAFELVDALMELEQITAKNARKKKKKSAISAWRKVVDG